MNKHISQTPAGDRLAPKRAGISDADWIRENRKRKFGGLVGEPILWAEIGRKKK